MRTLIRDGLGAVTALTTLGVLSLGGLAYAAEQPPDESDVQVQLCAAATVADANAILGANLGVDLPAGVRDAVNPGLLGGTLDSVRSTLGCAAEPDPTDEPDPTSETPVPTETATPAPTEDPTTPATPAPFVDRDCGDLAPGEAETLLAEDPTDPNGLDRNDNGVPCELDEFGDEATPIIPESNGGSGSTPGSGSNSQFDAMPSTAPETGRA